jgi:hypothetical protein
VFDDPQPPGPIQRTRFRFIPHGLDQIFAVNAKPFIYNNSVLSQLALQDNGLRYQLIGALSAMGDRMQAADIPAHVNSFVPLAMRLWRGTDPFFGADPSKTLQMAENVRLAAQQAVVDVRTVFGNGLTTQPFTTVRIGSPFYTQCTTRVSTNSEIGRAPCASLAGQQWTFESMPQSMGSSGFAQPLKLYRVRNQGTGDCLTAGAQFADGSDRYKLVVASCSQQTPAQRFFLNRREGRGLEIRSFARNSCVHFSGSALTSDGRPAVYLGPCALGEGKIVIVVE